jgi:hypothetical protein
MSGAVGRQRCTGRDSGFALARPVRLQQSKAEKRVEVTPHDCHGSLACAMALRGRNGGATILDKQVPGNSSVVPAVECWLRRRRTSVSLYPRRAAYDALAPDQFPLVIAFPATISVIKN